MENFIFCAVQHGAKWNAIFHVLLKNYWVKIIFFLITFDYDTFFQKFLLSKFIIYISFHNVGFWEYFVILNRS